VNAGSVATFSLVCEGAACGLFLMMAGMLWRDRSAGPAKFLSVLLAISGAASALNLGFDFRPANVGWQAPIHALAWGGPAILLLWARSEFDDEFVLRPWHGLLWVALAGGGLIGTYGEAIWPAAARVLAAVMPFIELAVPLLAAAQTVATWRADLVASRRRLRATVVAGTVIYIAFDTLAGLLPSAQARPSWRIAMDAAGLCALAGVAGWRILRITEDDDPAAAAPARIDMVSGKVPDAAADDGTKAADPVLLRRLDRLMIEDRVYRQEGLTIGALAVKLGIQEYRLRQVINEGLGYRNFNAFLNSYRINEAKAALADPGQKEVPILTVAMDAGFQSLGPFNRAFKADTGITPTEFRRDALYRLSDGAMAEGEKPGIDGFGRKDG
jgi:AraC-like DNA-binding protein